MRLRFRGFTVKTDIPNNFFDFVSISRQDWKLKASKARFQLTDWKSLILTSCFPRSNCLRQFFTLLLHTISMNYFSNTERKHFNATLFFFSFERKTVKFFTAFRVPKSFTIWKYHWIILINSFQITFFCRTFNDWLLWKTCNFYFLFSACLFWHQLAFGSLQNFTHSSSH